MIYKTNSAKETQELGAKVAKKFKKGGGVIALVGELGAGKTIFVQGFAKGLGIKDKITSPTFVLIRQHKLPNSKRILYHLDLYRLEGLEDINEFGIKDLFNNPENIILIEWAEKIKKMLPVNTFHIHFQSLRNNLRHISFKS